MKKLLVGMIVLGMASMANAQLYLTINETDNPTDAVKALAGDVLTIDIYGDGGTDPSCFFMDIGGVFTWDIAQAVINYQGNRTEIGIMMPYVYFMLDDAPPPGQPPNRPLGPTPKPLIDTILLTVGLGKGETDITNTITLYDLNLNPMGTYDVHITPEPMTMALLGLGGVALLRKRGA